MNFKNISNQDVHVLVNRYVKRNDKGQAIGRIISDWGIIKPGAVREILNDAIRGAQKDPALQVTDEKPTPRNVAVPKESEPKKTEAEISARVRK